MIFEKDKKYMENIIKRYLNDEDKKLLCKEFNLSERKFDKIIYEYESNPLSISIIRDLVTIENELKQEFSSIEGADFVDNVLIHSSTVVNLAKYILRDGYITYNRKQHPISHMTYAMVLFVCDTHDLYKMKSTNLDLYNHGEIIAMYIKEKLEERNVPKVYINTIFDAIKHHSDKKNISYNNIVGQLLKECDMLSKLTISYPILHMPQNKSLKESFNILKNASKCKVNIDAFFTEEGLSLYRKLKYTLI